MKPVVAITAVTRSLDVEMRERLSHATVNRRFGELVAAAGATPAFVGPDAEPAEVAGRFDGVVINGGQDVEPGRYGADAGPDTGPADPERDRFEIDLVKACRERGTPVLGICRGMHVVNVACGGTLVQHLPDRTDLGHQRRDEFDRTVHAVEIASGSRLAALLGRESLDVNSVHHQAVDEVGEGLAVAARAPDGVIEAVEGDGGLTLGVQWHPEFLTPDHDPVHLPLFAHLAEAR